MHMRKINKGIQKIVCLMLVLLLAAGPAGNAWAGESVSLPDAAESISFAEAEEDAALTGADSGNMEVEISLETEDVLPAETADPADGESTEEYADGQPEKDISEEEELLQPGLTGDAEPVPEELDELSVMETEENENTEETGMDEAEEEADKIPASEVGEAITELLGEAPEIGLRSEEELAVLQEQASLIREAYDSLEPEEQAVLDCSIESLGNMEAAVSSMQDTYMSLEQTGEVLLPQTDTPNSWRYINGQPIQDAILTAERETDAAVALEAGEDENIVQMLKSGEIATAEANASVYDLQDQPGAVLVGSSTTYMTGIDVSEHQYNINWSKVKNAGIQFAILRCGYGDDDPGQDDKYWERNVSECERLGIPYGVYIYSYATDLTMARSEAAHTLRLLQGHTPSLPVYYDIEDNSQIPLKESLLCSIAATWCAEIKAAGYNPGIYSSLSWWNGRLAGAATDETIYHWVAQWPNEVTETTTTQYTGRYEMWQYCSDGRVNGISVDVDMNRYYRTIPAPALEKPVKGVTYRSHVYHIGWVNPWKANGYASGTPDNTKMMDAIQVKIEGYEDLGIRYRCLREDIGWESWRRDGKTSGKSGVLAKAYQMELTGENADKYDIYYCVRVENIGWLNWACNGEAAGTDRLGYQMKAIRIKLRKKGAAAPAPMGNVTYAYNECDVNMRGFMQGSGWQAYVNEGELCGVQSGSKRLEAMRIRLKDAPLTGGITYQIRNRGTGWTGVWKKNGQVAGIKGGLTEAIKIKLTGKMAEEYDVYYSVYVQTKGWTAWTKNGRACGSAAMGLKMQGLKVLILPKGSEAPTAGGTAYFQKG